MMENRLFISFITCINLKLWRCNTVKEIRIELLGIGVILLGIAISTNNFWAYTLGTIGFGIVSMGCFWKDKK